MRIAFNWNAAPTPTGTGYTDAEFEDYKIKMDQMLPIELSSFTAETNGNKVNLNWSTAMEVNNYGFEVERSQKTEVGSQNFNWEKIGFVNGNGNSNSPKCYSFTDENPLAGKLQYRLKQIDNDGNNKYSQIVEASFMKPNKYELSQNYPNPFNPATTISYSIPKAGMVTIKIYDALGRELTELVNEEKSSGSYKVEFDGSRLSSGVYYYRIVSGSYTEIKKMVLMK